MLFQRTRRKVHPHHDRQRIQGDRCPRRRRMAWRKSLASAARIVVTFSHVLPFREPPKTRTCRALPPRPRSHAASAWRADKSAWLPAEEFNLRTESTTKATVLLNGSVGRTVRGGFGGTAPILAHGAGIPADLYGLHQDEILRQPVVGGSLSRALIGQPPVADSPLLHLA